MIPKLSKDSLEAALAYRRAQAAQDSVPMAASKPTRDNLKTASDPLPLIIKQGKKRVPSEMVEPEATSTCHFSLDTWSFLAYV